VSYIKHKVPRNGTFYVPKFAGKYKGEYPIICRSEWERVFCRWCDINPGVLRWSSETLAIPYYDPVRLKKRKYFPDFAINVDDGSDRDKIFIIEIKPYKDTKPPTRSRAKSEKTRITEARSWATNLAKWTAADNFCKKKGYEFKIITEKELFK